jgi:hypothetical protein
MLQAYKRNGKKLPSGLEFEAHLFPQLQQLETQPLTEDSSEVHRGLYGGKVYQAGPGVPLMLLVRSKYEARDESEAKELARKDRANAVTAEGWREFGEDFVAWRGDGGVLTIQAKNHKSLGLDALGTSLTRWGDCKESNEEHELDSACSSVLAFPSGTRFSHRTTRYLFGVYRKRYGLALLRVDDYTGTVGNPVGEVEGQPATYTAPDDSVSTTLARPRPVHKGPSMALRRERKKSRRQLEAEGAIDDDNPTPATAPEEAAPVAGSEEALLFGHQEDADQKATDAEGIAILVGPPGVGKTEIGCKFVSRQLLANGDTAVFVIAPYKAHARNWYLRFLGLDQLDTAGIPFAAKVWPGDGVDVGRRVVLVAGMDVYTDASGRILSRVRPVFDEKELFECYKNNGTRVFVATEASAHVLVKLMALLQEHRLGRGATERRVVFAAVKDELHYNSNRDGAEAKYSPGTQLLYDVLETGGKAIGTTASPNSAMAHLPNAKTEWEMFVPEAIRRKLIAPHKFILPSVIDMSEQEEKDGDIWTFLTVHEILGLKVLFIVHGMLQFGVRRCIFFAADTKEMRAAIALLPEACRLMGANCWAEEISMETKNSDFEDRLRNFQDVETDEVDFYDGKLCYRTTLCFLGSIDVLNMAVNVPHCDSTYIMSPPKKGSLDASALAYQRCGRAWRFKFLAYNFFWTTADSDFFGQFVGYLKQRDPTVLTANRFRTLRTNVHGANTPEAIKDDLPASLEALHSRFKMKCVDGGSEEELFRRRQVELIGDRILTKADALNPETGRLVDWPCDGKNATAEDIHYKLAAFVKMVKERGTRFQALAVYLGQQKKEWTAERLGAMLDALKPTSHYVKVQLLAKHYPTKRPTEGTRTTFTHADSPGILEEGVEANFDVGKFVTSILWQFAGEDKRQGETALDPSSIQLARDKCTWLPTALEERAARSASQKASQATKPDVKAQLFAKHYPTKRPTTRTRRTFTHADSPDILKEGVEATFDVGKFVTLVLWQFAGDDKRSCDVELDPSSIQLMRDKCTWLPMALEERAVKSTRQKASHAIKPNVKAQLFAKHYPTKRPTAGTRKTFTHADSPDILKEGVEATFDVGEFVTSILWQFAGDDKRRGETALDPSSIQLMRDKCTWLPTALEERAVKSARQKASHAIKPDVKAQLIAKHYPTKRPTEATKTFTHADSPDILKEGVETTFDVGKFVTSILWQFAGDDKRRFYTNLDPSSIQLMRDKCTWLPTALEERAVTSARQKANKRKRAEEASTSTAAADDDDDDTDEA